MATLLERGKIIDEFGNVLNPYQRTVDYIVDQITRKKEILNVGDKVWLLKAGTSSGKSVVTPAYLYLREKKGLIICLQPRIYNCLSIPQQIALYTPEFVIGENLGFSTSIKKVLIKDNGLMFATIDTLLSQMKTLSEDAFITKYKYIIVDEVHVRNIGLDLLLFKLKIIMAKHLHDGKCPTLILMSATFDVPKFAKFFGTKNIIIAQGKSFPIDAHFLASPSTDVVQDVAKRILSIIEENDDPQPLRDILVFVPGKGMAKKISDIIEPLIPSFKKPLIILTVESSNVTEVKPLIEEPNDVRRLLLSTSVIETGVTVNTLKYVIEPGFGNIMEYNPVKNAKSLLVKPIDQGSATQRVGRVGRKAPGIAYHMYTEDTFKNHMPENSLPDILTGEISEALLYILIDRFEFDMIDFETIIKLRKDHAAKQMVLVNRGVKSNSIDNIDMLDQPSGESILRGMTILHQIGAIDKDNMPTIDGLMMYKMTRLSMEARKMLLSSMVFNVSFKDLNILAWAFNNSNDLKKEKPLLKAYIKNEMLNELGWGTKFYPFIMDNAMDLFFLYKVFKKQMKIGGVLHAQAWCEKVGASYHTMVLLISMAYEVMKTCDRVGFNYNSSLKYSFKNAIKKYNETDNHQEYIEFIKRFKLCVYQGYKANLAIHNEKGYRTASGINLNLEGTEAHHVIYYDSMFMARGDKIRLASEYYSVMSGYVGMDENFY